MYEDFFNLLKTEHDEVKVIISKMAESSESSPKSRDLFLQQCQEMLIPHLKAEEAVYYPALKNHKKAFENALEALEEHHLIELVLNELAETGTNSEMWGAKAKVLEEVFAHHIKREESEVFNLTHELLSEAQVNSLRNDLIEEKARHKDQAA